ncbi:hypothetical protein PENTCL1PPCAC_16618, partial [Pristionchus entomophagus]
SLHILLPVVLPLPILPVPLHLQLPHRIHHHIRLLLPAVPVPIHSARQEHHRILLPLLEVRHRILLHHRSRPAEEIAIHRIKDQPVRHRILLHHRSR